MKKRPRAVKNPPFASVNFKGHIFSTFDKKHICRITDKTLLSFDHPPLCCHGGFGRLFIPVCLFPKPAIIVID